MRARTNARNRRPGLTRPALQRVVLHRIVQCALVSLLLPAATFPQEPTAPLTVGDAIQLSIKNYPALKERRARAQAAEEGVGVARTAYLPRLDLVWQENRATVNNGFGL